MNFTKGLGMNRLVMRSKANRGTHPLVHQGNEKIKKRLQKGRERRRALLSGPAQKKED